METARGNSFEKSSEHKVYFDNRKEGAFTGIIDVISFDTEEVVLESKCGGIIIKGSELHVKNLNLDRGDVNIEGTIDSMVYTKSKLKSNESLIKKLFK